MKNSNDTIGNRTPDLPTCSAVPQPTAPPRFQTTNNLVGLTPASSESDVRVSCLWPNCGLANHKPRSAAA